MIAVEWLAPTELELGCDQPKLLELVDEAIGAKCVFGIALVAPAGESETKSKPQRRDPGGWREGKARLHPRSRFIVQSSRSGGAEFQVRIVQSERELRFIRA